MCEIFEKFVDKFSELMLTRKVTVIDWWGLLEYTRTYNVRCESFERAFTPSYLTISTCKGRFGLFSIGDFMVSKCNFTIGPAGQTKAR